MICYNIVHALLKSLAKASAAVKRVKSKEIWMMSWWIQPRVAGSRSVITEQFSRTWVHRSSVSSHCLPQVGQVGVWPSGSSLRPSKSPLFPIAPRSWRLLPDRLRSQLGFRYMPSPHLLGLGNMVVAARAAARPLKVHGWWDTAVRALLAEDAVGKGHQVGAEAIRLETLWEEDVVSKEGGKGGVKPNHSGVLSIKLVVVYKQMSIVDGIHAGDLRGNHGCYSHEDKGGCPSWGTGQRQRGLDGREALLCQWHSS